MFNHFSWSSFKNLVKQVVPDKKLDKAKGIIKWQTEGSNANDFPQQLIQNVYNSSVGSGALDLWAEFVEGSGLLDETSGLIKINKDQTLNDLHALLSVDLSYMWGYSFIQRYTPEGEPSERWHLPFEETRLGIQDESGEVKKIFHNPYYGIPKSFNDKDTKWFYAYNPEPTFVKSQIESHNKEFLNEKTGKVEPPYPGQAFWFSIEKPLARVYPQPFFYSSIDWFQVDAEIPSFHERNIKNNLMPSVLINMHGDPSKPAGPPADTDATTNKQLDQGETVGDVMNRQMKTFTDEKGGVLINWFLKDEEKATFEAFPTSSHAEEWITLQKLATDQIAIGTKVPRILIGIGESGKLGDTQEILNAIRVMQGRTLRMRNILKKTYEKVFGIPDGTIENINPVNVIPDKVWTALTLEEQRNYIDQNFDVDFVVKEEGKKKPTDDPAQAAAQAQLKGSVGGVTGILGIQAGVSSGTTTPESGIAVLELIYGFSEEEARALLGTPKELNPSQNGS